MSNKTKNMIFTSFIFSVMLVNLGYASGLQSMNVTVYLNNTLLHGQQLPPLQSTSEINWKINATFGGLAHEMSSTINQSQINYTDSTGVTSTSGNALEILWDANPALETYQINGSNMQPVNVVSSNIVLGTVSQTGIYSTATAAPQCSNASQYTEWDFYITTQKNYSQSTKNIVVGRVCFYVTTIGYAQALPKAPISQLSSTLVLTAGTQQENFKLNYNSTYAASSDGLARVHWIANHVYATATPPNGSGYFAVNNIKSGKWYVHNNGTYSKWYNQLYTFAFEFIPQHSIFYSPNNIGILSPNCGISTSNLTNQSILSVVQCMNNTAKVYYSQANFLAAQLVSSSQNVSNYPTSSAVYLGKPAITVGLPSIFVENPIILLNLSGSFTGVFVPAGRPAIISVSSTALNTFGIGTVVTQVENTGTSSALFNVSIAGCPNIATPGGVSYQLLQGQGEEISTAIVAAGSSKTLNENCRVVVTDLSGGGSASANVTITSGPGETILNAIYKFLSSL